MQFTDIIFEKKDGVAKITMNRPNKLNAFRTETVVEMVEALEDIEADPTIGVVALTGVGDRAFCVGGDAGDVADGAGYSPKLLRNIFRVHELLRKIPVPTIAAVNGYAIGGGHVLHVLCDLTIASDKARFAQVGPKVGSFDAGLGSAYLARVVGEKKAREIWFLCEQFSAEEAREMGLVNKVVPHEKLGEELDAWCKKILALSPTALKVLKQSFNADTDHLAGFESMCGSALWMYYQDEEAMEGRNAFMEKRPPDFSKFRK